MKTINKNLTITKSKIYTTIPNTIIMDKGIRRWEHNIRAVQNVRDGVYTRIYEIINENNKR